MPDIKCRMDYESFPSHFQIIWQILFMMLTEDTCFYWCHRTLHHPKLYPLIHKIHHEYNTPISLCSIYAHPLEYLVGNLLPTSIGMLLL